ncbi:hypothetical protein NL676_039741 [Syzygium grande]|nr:hypothetical protein NL676_039741 [Syzygium grande]
MEGSLTHSCPASSSSSSSSVSPMTALPQPQERPTKVELKREAVQPPTILAATSLVYRTATTATATATATASVSEWEGE